MSIQQAPPMTDPTPPGTCLDGADAANVAAIARHTCDVVHCGAAAECELFDGTWLCERHFARVTGDVAALAGLDGYAEAEAVVSASLFRVPAIPRTDPIQEARDLVRGAMAELGPLNVALNAHACDDDFGQPNRASIAMAKLALALECLREVGR